ncbi:hypothetical protein CARUB_v10018743mg [Capsella rubella]|uniref:RBR-type E3 ubiquitin transferase n=1 Tax=Capsella rubella TaxID=81985 RepID=R0FSL6_9BRAS|nr:hypothetical protein CARUB_v10018743mg [Capsella rubella]
MYRLYFKGFVNKETKGFGVAICDQEDNLLFHVKGSRHHDYSTITVLEAELIALRRGLSEAIFELVAGISAPEQDNIAFVMDHVQHIRKQFTSTTPVLMTRNQAKFAYKLAMETKVSKVTIDHRPSPAERKTCVICFKDDFKPEDMFSIDLCGHHFCVECMKQHISVRLLEGSEMRCPNYQCRHYYCTSKLTHESCANLLTPELREMWELRIKKETVPVADKVYCPNPRCSALISKTGDGVRRWCTKCGKHFCINCKVQWHKKKSCEEYKKLGPNPNTTRMLRKCSKCQYMFKLRKDNIDAVTCSCGYKFCYTCGAEWKRGGCSHRERRFWECSDIYGLIGIFMVGTAFAILKFSDSPKKH